MPLLFHLFEYFFLLERQRQLLNNPLLPTYIVKKEIGIRHYFHSIKFEMYSFFLSEIKLQLQCELCYVSWRFYANLTDDFVMPYAYLVLKPSVIFT